MSSKTKVQSSLFIKILLFTLMLSLIPLVLFGIYNYSLVTELLKENTKGQVNDEISNILNEKYLIIEKDANALELKLKQIEANLIIVQKQIEFLYSNNNISNESIILEEDSKGFLWQPYENSLDQSNIFVSARSKNKKNLNEELLKIKEIDTLLKGIFNNSQIAHSIWFCHSSSAILAYPAYNFKEKIHSGEIPPNVNVQEYEFYYIVDKVHNPSQKIKWTNPYRTFTYYSNWVISASAPIYSNNGKLIGVVGFDIPLENLSTNLIKSQFSKDEPAALIIDEKRNIIAQNNQLDKIIPKQDNNNLKALKNIYEFNKKRKHISKIKINNKYYYLITKKMDSPEWYYQALIPEKNLTDSIMSPFLEKERDVLRGFFGKLIIIGFISVSIIIYISYFFAFKITRPIVNLSRALNDFTKGKFSKIPVEHQDEIGELISSYNTMSIRIQNLLDSLQNRALEINEKNEKLEHFNNELILSNEKYRMLEETKSELIMQLSHDLKTPLTSIKGTVEILDLYNLSIEDQKKSLEHILLKINHVSGLIDDLNEITQLDIPEIQYNKEYLPIDLLLDYSIELASSQIHSKKVEFIREYQPDILVYVDPRKLYRALYNLFVNSIKYSDRDKTIIIVKAIQVSESLVRIEIEDNGIGISPENINKVFDKFYRERRNVEAGSGLGMTITKKIIENHGGSIEIFSSMNKGTIVTIILPVN